MIFQTTSTVQYLETQPISLGAFAPGRGIPPSCLNWTSPPRASGRGSCTIGFELTGVDNDIPQTLKNQAEYVMTAGNQSAINQIYTADGQTILGPKAMPDDTDFTATSFGSRTSCKTVTNLCGIYNFSESYEIESTNRVGFACNLTTAGMNISGNLDEVNAPVPGLFYNSSDMYDIINNTLSQDNVFASWDAGGLGFQYFDDASKAHRSFLSGPTDMTNPSLWWALLFVVSSSGLGNDPHLNIFHTSRLTTRTARSAGGILSCATNLSDVVSRSSICFPLESYLLTSHRRIGCGMVL